MVRERVLGGRLWRSAWNSFPKGNRLCRRGCCKQSFSVCDSLCRGRPYWTLARPSSTCSDWDGRSSQRQSSIFNSSVALPPAGFLQTDVRVHHKVTQDSPSRGAVTGHSQSQVHTHRPDTMQARGFWRERTTTKPGGYNIKSPCSCD